MGVLRLVSRCVTTRVVVLVSFFAFAIGVTAAAGNASAVEPWGEATDGAPAAGLAATDGQLAARWTLRGSTALNDIADDIVGATDMVVAVEDDPIEWASFVGPESDHVLGFVYFFAPPSPLYHAVFLSPYTYQAWDAWFASGSPAGNEWAFSVSAMALIHESLHWRMLSRDESSVNACALKYFAYYLARDFNVPETLTQITIERVAVKTIKQVPVTKVVVKKVRVKVNGKWVMRPVRTHVTTYVSKSSTEYVDQPVTRTVPNPLYQTLVADSVDFYTNHQVAPYNTGVCPM